MQTGIKYTPNDKLWSLVVRTRDGWTCSFCGKDFSNDHIGLDAAHIHVTKRGKWSSRHDPLAGIALCKRDHKIYDGRAYKDTEKSRNEQIRMETWIEWYLGQEKWEKIMLLKNRVTPGVRSASSQALINLHLHRELAKLTK